jgi:hypothetical protein
MARSTLSAIACAETLEHKLHFAWKYCQEIEVQYNPVDSISRHPVHVADMIWAHGRQGNRKAALKKIDAMDIVCQFLSLRGEAAA